MASAAARRPGARVHGAVTKAMENNKTAIRRGRADIHRDQAIVERFNRTLAERLFEHQYAVEMNLPSGRSTAWVKRLPDVVSALNNEVTRLTGKKPAQAIKEKAVSSKPATPYMRPVGYTKRNSRHNHMCDTCTTPGSWKGAGDAQPTPSGL